MKADNVNSIVSRLEKLPYKAILFDGEWGIGKTYAVNEALKGNANVCRISMFGLNAKDQIYHEVLFQLALKNNIGGKLGEIANNVIEGLSNVSAAIGQVKEVIQSFAKERELFLLLSKQFEQPHVIVIDDLERMSENLNLEEVFGIIEELKQCPYVKVIIICNSEKLKNKKIFEEYKEKVMIAVGDSPLAFKKLPDWELVPPDELGQKRDFRDPQAYYDPETGTISLTVTAAQDGVARILKFTLSADLQTAVYDGIIFTDPTGDFWNLECSDTFRIGDTWYITYSRQDDTLWFASSHTPYDPYGEAKRVDGKLFYAAKHVEDGENAYMVGWARRSSAMSSTAGVTDWAGNLVVQKIVQTENGDLVLVPVDAITDGFTVRRLLAIEEPHMFVEAEDAFTYTDVFTCYESFLLSGEFRYEKGGSFGLSFDFNGDPELNKFITINPAENKLQLWFNNGTTLITEAAAELQPGKTYSFTYIQEGSVGIFYIDNMSAPVIK